MKKILTLAAISLLSATSMIAREPTIIPDFQPEIKVSGEMMSNQFNTIPTFPKDTVISNLIVSLTFPGTYATWAINSADYVKVYNKAGEEVTPPKFEIGRPSDAGWNVITFNFYGWDQCDPNTDFTVKAAEGIIGDRAWEMMRMSNMSIPLSTFPSTYGKCLASRAPTTPLTISYPKSPQANDRKNECTANRRTR